MAVILKDLDPIACPHFLLPNSISLFNDGSLAVADGGSNGVFILSTTGKLLQSIMATGFSQYSFRQPVAIGVSPIQKVYVADWHNHRIVIYDNKLKYEAEIGRFGTQSSIKTNHIKTLREWIAMLRIYLSNPAYIDRHFSDKCVTHIRQDHFIAKIARLFYLYHRKTSSTLSFNLNKPNGIAFLDTFLYITQKNSNCISMLEKKSNQKYELIKTQRYGIGGDLLGRLGSLCIQPNGQIFVCDEYNHGIWIFRRDLKPLGKLTGSDSGMGCFMPFACCLVREKFLAVCGGLRFQLIDLQSQQVVFNSRNLGELHGVAFDDTSSILYVCNRSEAVINRFLFD